MQQYQTQPLGIQSSQFAGGQFAQEPQRQQQNNINAQQFNLAKMQSQQPQYGQQMTTGQYGQNYGQQNEIQQRQLQNQQNAQQFNQAQQEYNQNTTGQFGQGFGQQNELQQRQLQNQQNAQQFNQAQQGQGQYGQQFSQYGPVSPSQIRTF